VRPRAASRLAEAAASGACVIIVDDVMTTGATIASLAIRLADAGVTVAVATTLAATERHPR
jgi:predicted amidophosphoribosyltransferase